MFKSISYKFKLKCFLDFNGMEITSAHTFLNTFLIKIISSTIISQK